jgi:Ferritin-like
MTNPKLIHLYELLQKALELELFTIPPYLTALYSIKDGVKGRNSYSANIILSVVMEEMLHATLVANVMNAVGAKPLVSPELSKGKLKKCQYPSSMPHIRKDLKVSLSRFSRDAILDFRKIEEPEKPEEWQESIENQQIHSIGHLYQIVLEHLIALANDLGEKKLFVGNQNLQIDFDKYYGAHGRAIRVEGLADAMAAVSEVSQQGEGRVHVTNLTGDELLFHQPGEVAHYYRFQQILAEHFYDRGSDLTLRPSGPRLPVYWSAVYKIRPLPDKDSTGPAGLAELLTSFDATYTDLMKAIHKGFNGEPKVLTEATQIMKTLDYETVALMQVDVGNGETCGPPFWFVKS